MVHSWVAPNFPIVEVLEGFKMSTALIVNQFSSSWLRIRMNE
jgi:hypothetical protein